MSLKKSGLMNIKKKKASRDKDPWWKKRITAKIRELRKDISKLDQWHRKSLNSEHTKKRLEQVYHVQRKETLVVIEELKQRVKAKAAKIKKYEERNNQFLQNRLFQTNRKRLFEKIDGKERNYEIKPDAEESKTFWSNIWGIEKKHNEDAEWLKDVEESYRNIPQESFQINQGKIKKQLSKLPNWKACGPDKVHGYWLKIFNSVHERMPKHLQHCIDTGEVPNWMVEGRTTLTIKDVSKGTLVSNFRPITCLAMMWKLMTGLFAEEIYDHLETNKLLPEEQKGCRRNRMGTKDQLLIDRVVIKTAKEE